MKKLLKIILPILVIAGAMGMVRMMVANRPPPPKVEPEKIVQAVEATTVKRQDVSLVLPSQGMIEPERMTVLAAEVGGRVAKVSPKFDAGQSFDEGEVLVELDAADYEAAATQSEAAVADAKLALATEQAKADQAVRDWGKLAANEKPTDLVLRKPHIESATARIKAAEAALVKARRDLERTKIRAPYRGRVRAIHTELGSVLMPGARVAEIYSSGACEVRLPLSLDDYAFAKPVGGPEQAAVRLATTFGGREIEWKGRVMRVEGEVERASRSVYLIASVEEEKSAEPILKPGLFVRARIDGQQLKNVFRVPRRAFLDEQRVLVVDGGEKLRFRQVKVVRADGGDLLVSEGLQDGDRICMTALAAPVDGMTVRVIEPAADAISLGKQL